MTTLYLVRHGETVDNAAQILQGQTPGKLNEKGIQQAEEVARKMANNHIDVFVASDLWRSIQTCEIIARPHLLGADGLPLSDKPLSDGQTPLSGGNTPLSDEQIEKYIVTTPLLRERDWGDFTGEYIPSLADREWPANVESLERMLSRAQNFLTWLRITYPDQTVLAVGHGIINKAIQSGYYQKPMSQVPRMDNAEVRVLIL